jgi:cell wall-associated NlpC family hydrolase
LWTPKKRTSGFTSGEIFRYYLTMRYRTVSLLLGLIFLGPSGVTAAESNALDGQAAGAVVRAVAQAEARAEGTPRSAITTVTRVARSGPVFGLAALAAVTATRAARNPVSVYKGEQPKQAPVAAASTVNILLNTAKTTAVSASLLPVVTTRYAETVAPTARPELPPIRYSDSATPVQRLIGEGLRHIGVPYRWGGTSARHGMDCSGLVQVVFRDALGINLPRTSLAMATQGSRVSLRDLRAGDLVFFNTIGRDISHVGIYVGNGRFLNAPSTGNFVRIDKLYSRYWGTRYVTARRIIGETRLASGPTSPAAPPTN